MSRRSTARSASCINGTEQVVGRELAKQIKVEPKEDLTPL
jgi:hypothetical protein